MKFSNSPAFQETVTGDATAVSNGAATSTEKKTSKKEIKEITIPAGMFREVCHFRKEKVKDEATGQEIGEGYKHPSIAIALPLPSKEELLAIFSAPSEGEGSKAAEQKYVIDLIKDAYYVQAREQINDWREQNPKDEVSTNILDYNKISITALANMPASERGNKIDEEAMKDFLADYIAIMPAASGKDASKVKAQAGLLEKQLRTVRTDKKVLTVMDGLLAIWANATTAMDENQQVYEFLTNRIKRWLTAEPKNVLESIY